LVQLRKDDILGIRQRLACHQIILDHQSLFENYVRHCRAVVDLVIEHLNTNLQLSYGTLAGLHRIDQPSGDHVRFTQSPPQPFDEERFRRAEHTDFGSLTVLFNWISGLQIRTPDTNEWVYVKPVPGSCIVNLGDALVTFTGGILRSNVHRVVPPVGEQASLTRNSLVFFTRPEDAVVMKRIKGGIIDLQPESNEQDSEMTAEEWIFKRGTGQLPGVFTSKGFEPAKFTLAPPKDLPAIKA
jgi:isopenicillin N synthase-like dioxygenase